MPSGKGAHKQMLVGKITQKGGKSFPQTVKIPLASAADTAGAAAAWQNPESGPILIDRAVLDVTTPATAAGTLKVGVAATATTTGNNLIDTLDVHTAAITADNLGSPGTNGKQFAKLQAGQFVTASTASGSIAGLVGNLYLTYWIL